MVYSNILRKLLHKWPGKASLGIYRFLPAFFVAGASLEWIMINARIAPGGETFYDVFRRKQSERSQEVKLIETSGNKHRDTMPVGVSWSKYFTFFAASMLTMMAGAQVVHSYYKPDMSIPTIPPEHGELGRQQNVQTQQRQDE